MRVVSIHQPPYFPWFGLLDKIARSDVFIILDTVQYNKRAFQHRTLYSHRDGPRYLSLSVNSKGVQVEGTAIRDITLADLRAPAKHLETLRHRYHGRPGWRLFYEQLTPLLNAPPEHLVDLNVETLRISLEIFGLRPAIYRASELAVSGAKSELMLRLTQAAGGDTYLSGLGAKDYMDDDQFRAAGIAVAYQEFVHPVYAQSQGGAFQAGCFALEWFLEDPEGARAGFHRHLARTGGPPPRCLLEA